MENSHSVEVPSMMGTLGNVFRLRRRWNYGCGRCYSLRGERLYNVAHGAHLRYCLGCSAI